MNGIQIILIVAMFFGSIVYIARIRHRLLAEFRVLGFVVRIQAEAAPEQKVDAGKILEERNDEGPPKVDCGNHDQPIGRN